MTRAAIPLVAALALWACDTPRAVTVAPTPPRSPLVQLRADLDAIFDTPQFRHSFWSVLIAPAGAGDDLYARNADKLMMPGSAMKILTAAAAAEVLGWDHRFETKVVRLAPLDGGVLRGDLIVIGGGDPSISERSDTPGVLRAIARQVRNAGVSQIEGGVIGHDDLFDDRGYGAGWTLDNLPYGYSAPVSALLYNEGAVDLVVRAGNTAGEPVRIEVRPEGSGLEIDNQLVTASASAAASLTLSRPPGSPRIVVRGQIPERTPPFVRTAAVDNPTRFFASAFRRALVAEGVRVAGDAADIDDFLAKPDLAAASTIVSHVSPPLRELVSSMMKVSQNQYAEALLRAVGAGETAGATDAMGASRVREVLQGWNVGEGDYVMADGSGLSRYNYVTSAALVRVLGAMRASARHSAFAETLPVAGRDGTLARRMSGTPAEGRVRAKTGTIDNVRAIAGYVDTAGGEALVFSIIANNFTLPTSAVDAAADAALVRLATFTRSQTGGSSATAP